VTLAPADLSFEATSRTLDGEHPVHYHVAGTGPGLLLLHGSGPGVSGWANFGPLVPAFAAGHRVVVPDQPGYARSYVPALDRDYAEISIEAIRRVLDAEGLDRVHVVGNSLGAMVGARLALDHPDTVDRLVMMGPGGVGFPLFGPQPTEGIKRLVEFTTDPTREKLRAWMESMVGDPAFLTEERVQARWEAATAPGALQFTKDFYAAAMRGMRANPTPPLWTRLGRLRLPVLITFGREDRVTPLESAFLPLRLMPMAELHVFSGSGHWTMLERQGDFERVVLEFLGR
jgi:pimeloyl-ACP methyl ester carboxylesterase